MNVIGQEFFVVVEISGADGRDRKPRGRKRVIGMMAAILAGRRKIAVSQRARWAKLTQESVFFCHPAD